MFTTKRQCFQVLGEACDAVVASRCGHVTVSSVVPTTLLIMNRPPYKICFPLSSCFCGPPITLVDGYTFQLR